MDLHLNVKSRYFNQYIAGQKPYEYRLYNDYWKKRLVGKSYNTIHYKAGYPSKDQASKIRIMPYCGYKIQTIQHPHFGDKPVKVFAIKLDSLKAKGL